MTDFKAALSVQGENKFQLRNVAVGELLPGEILVRIVATGICHTDAICHNGHFPLPKPIILGHEGAGVVERVVNAGDDIQPGDHVCLTFNSCGQCDSCRDEAPYYCAHFLGANIVGRRLDGTSPIQLEDGADVGGQFFGQSSFAQYAVANKRNVIKVPKDAPLEMLGPLGCGIQTGVGAIWNVLKSSEIDKLAVFGAGTVGLSAIMAARLSKPDALVAVDPNPQRRALALDLGATHAFDPTDVDVPEWFGNTTGQLTQAVDTTGLPALIKSISMALGPRGQLVLLGAAPDGTELQFDLMYMLNNGITVKSVIEGESDSKTLIPHLTRLQKDGQFPFEKLVKYYDFTEIDAAMADHLSGKVIKPILRIGKI